MLTSWHQQAPRPLTNLSLKRNRPPSPRAALEIRPRARGRKEFVFKIKDIPGYHWTAEAKQQAPFQDSSGPQEL